MLPDFFVQGDYFVVVGMNLISSEPGPCGSQSKLCWTKFETAVCSIPFCSAPPDFFMDMYCGGMDRKGYMESERNLITLRTEGSAVS